MKGVAGTISPIWLAFCSVNQRLPKGPVVISHGMLLAVRVSGMKLNATVAPGPGGPDGSGGQIWLAGGAVK